MELKVCQVGNGWFLSLPREAARTLGVTPGDRCDATVQHGRLVAVPKHDKPFRLDDLLAGITADNLHQEAQTGAPVGQEVW